MKAWSLARRVRADSYIGFRILGLGCREFLGLGVHACFRLLTPASLGLIMSFCRTVVYPQGTSEVINLEYRGLQNFATAKACVDLSCCEPKH